MASVTTIASHLTSTFLYAPVTEFCRLSQSLHSSQRPCTRKLVSGTISASIDLKPPPYALV
ncbi:hypothetical protein HanPI659440_Chr08g0293711 [Helianthus annuus]|nr:hypothetical protein HanPI659440_Chr08g0293711 [Helianthus annuus]